MVTAHTARCQRAHKRLRQIEAASLERHGLVRLALVAGDRVILEQLHAVIVRRRDWIAQVL